MRQAGFTLVEMSIALVIAVILGTMAMAGFSRARAAANESSATASLKSINIAQTSYNAACGRGGFARTLVILGQPPFSGASGGYVDPELATAQVVQHSGYRMQIVLGLGAVAGNTPDCNNNSTITGYRATAVPVAFGSSGSRSFATSQVGNIWQNHTDTPPAEPFGPPSEMFK